MLFEEYVNDFLKVIRQLHAFAAVIVRSVLRNLRVRR